MERYEPETISRGDAYAIAANPRRQRVIRLLLEDRRAWQVEGLARTIAARDQECAPSEVDEQCRRRIHLSLVHSHLPELAAEDVVVVEDETVAPGETIDDLAPLVT